MVVLLVLLGYTVLYLTPAVKHDNVAAKQFGREQVFKLDQCYRKKGDYTKCPDVLARSGVMASLSSSSYQLEVNLPYDRSSNVMTFKGSPDGPPAEGCIDHSTLGSATGCNPP
jgi:hypothetical protein